MGFLKLMDKKNVPDELPTLISEDIKKKSDEKKVYGLNEEFTTEMLNKPIAELGKREENNLPESKPIQSKENQINKKHNRVTEERIEPEKNINENYVEKDVELKKDIILEKKNYSKPPKDSFFTNLQENLNNEMDNINHLEEWYNNKLLPEDTLSEMKKYWEEQKSSSVIQVMGKDFQNKISDKINLLQELEKKWQESYFNIIEKEEQIKEQEKELKKMLAEFIGFCKKRVKSEKPKDKR
jgi:hypothetical protein